MVAWDLRGPGNPCRVTRQTVIAPYQRVKNGRDILRNDESWKKQHQDEGSEFS
jgi:hypothetical protein